jgi:hypothetical protein
MPKSIARIPRDPSFSGEELDGSFGALAGGAFGSGGVDQELGDSFFEIVG